MPLYDYKCQSCDHAFRKLKQISKRHEPTKEPCPECGEAQIVNVIGCPAVAYNQPGVHKTTDNFNDRLKQIKENVGSTGKDNLSNVIR